MGRLVPGKINEKNPETMYINMFNKISTFNKKNSKSIQIDE